MVERKTTAERRFERATRKAGRCLLFMVGSEQSGDDWEIALDRQRAAKLFHFEVPGKPCIPSDSNLLSLLKLYRTLSTVEYPTDQVIWSMSFIQYLVWLV